MYVWQQFVIEITSLLPENHMQYVITQFYLPPGSGDFPAFTPVDAAWYMVHALDLASPEGCKAELT